jgi:hypothetical protein
LLRPSTHPAARDRSRPVRRGGLGRERRPLGPRLSAGRIAAYLRDRHLVRHLTVNMIAAEIGMSHHTVEAALRRHALTRMPHAAKRHAAGQRAAGVAVRLGYQSIATYVSARRAGGWTWSAIAAESGQPQTWLRRQATQGP